ncbi:aminotransferase class IV, partial [Bacteroides fragilis]|nr:aminotransferase class IV [Bacteroides fragilis]
CVETSCAPRQRRGFSPVPRRLRSSNMRSSRAIVLEGATSTVVAVRGNKLRTPSAKGILSGTTQAALFEYAQQQGYR